MFYLSIKHLGCFYFLTTMNNASMSIDVQILVDTLLFPLGVELLGHVIIGVESLGHMVILCLTF